MTHGCASKTPVLPGEDLEVRNRRQEAWTLDLGAVTEPERFLVATAVDASCCMERAHLADVAAITLKIHHTAESFVDASAAEVEQLTGRLTVDPTVVRQLRLSSLGCRWLIGRWKALSHRLQTSGWLEISHRLEGVALMGKRPGDLFKDSAVTEWFVAHVGALIGAKHDGQEIPKFVVDVDSSGEMASDEFHRHLNSLTGTFPDAERARGMLGAIIVGAIEELTERLDLISAREDRDLGLAIDAARIDASAEGARRLRYLMAHERVLRASLRELRALQASRPEQSSDAAPSLLPMSTADASVVEAPTEPNAVAPTEPKPVAPTEPKPVAPTEPKPVVLTEPKPVAPTEPKTNDQRPQPDNSSNRTDEPPPRVGGTGAGTSRFDQEAGTEVADDRGDVALSQDRAA